MKYVAYYRASTKRQGKSGLGLAAQKKTVYAEVAKHNVIAEFTEIESGSKRKRIELLKAINLCQEKAATLIVAKLDRLARDIEFTFTIKNSGIQVKACDIKDFSTLTVGIYATMAQYEAEQIRKRIKDALAIKKARGEKLGKPENLTNKSRAISIQARKELALNRPENKLAYKIIQDWRGKISLNAIAKKLNEYGLKTVHGKFYTFQQVKNLVGLFEA